MLIPAENVDSRFGAKFLNLKSLVVFVSRVKHAANLARLGITPSIHFTAFSKREGMVRARSDFLDSDFGVFVEKIWCNSSWLQYFS